MTENERWQATLAALRAIANDPAETPARRTKAQRALMSASFSSGLPLSGAAGRQRHTSGGRAQFATDTTYHGTGY